MRPSRRHPHRRPSLEPVERRLLFAITLSGSPTPVGSINTATFADFTLTAIGTSGNSLIAFPNANKLFGRIVTSAGVPVGNEFQISATGQTVSRFTGFDAITDPAGNVFVAYAASASLISDTDVFFVKLDPTGTPLYAPVDAGALPMSQSRPSLALAGSVLGVAFDSVTSNFGRNSAIYFSTFNPDTGAVLFAATNVSVPQDPIPGGGILDRSPSLVYSSLADQFTLVNLRQTFTTQGAFQGMELDARTISTAGVASAQVTVFAEPGNNVTLGVPRAIDTSAGVGLFYTRTTFDPQNLLSYQSSAIISNFLGNDATPDAAPVTVKSVAGPTQIGLAQVTPIPVASSSSGAVTLGSASDPSVGLMQTTGTFDISNGLVAASTAILTATAKTGLLESDDEVGPTKSDAKSRFTGPGNLVAVTTSAGTSTTTNVNVQSATVVAQESAIVIANDAFGIDDANSVNVKITLSKRLNVDVSVNVKTRLNDPNDSALAGVDFTAFEGVVTIPAGQTEALFNVTIRKKTAATVNKVFTYDITPSSGPITANPSSARVQIPKQTTSSDPFFRTLVGLTFPIAYANVYGNDPLNPDTTVAIEFLNSRNPNRTPPEAKSQGKVEVKVTSSTGVTTTAASVPVTLTAKPSKVKKILKLFSGLLPGIYTITTNFVPAAGSMLSASDVETKSINPKTGADFVTVTIGNIVKSGDKPLTVGDKNNTFGTLSITGPGSATLITDTNGNQSLVASGTTSATTITFARSKKQPLGSTRRLTVKDILTDGPVGILNTTDVDVSRNIIINGRITKGAFGNVPDNHLISIGSGSVPATLSFINLQDVTFTSGQPIKSLALNSWLDTDATPDTLSAPSIAALVVKGHLQSSLTLTGPLGTAIIGGDFTGSLSASSIKSLTVKSVLGSPLPASPSRVFATTSIGKVSAGAARNLFFSAGTRTGLTTLPTSSADFLSTPSSIAAFSITGIPGQSSLFSNTILAARTLGPVQIKGLTPTSPNTPPTPFGIRALSIASYTQGTTKAKKTTTPTPLDTSADFSAATLG